MNPKSMHKWSNNIKMISGERISSNVEARKGIGGMITALSLSAWSKSTLDRNVCEKFAESSKSCLNTRRRLKGMSELVSGRMIAATICRQGKDYNAVLKSMHTQHAR